MRYKIIQIQKDKEELHPLHLNIYYLDLYIFHYAILEVDCNRLGFAQLSLGN